MCELHKMLMHPLDSDTDVYSVYESHEVDDYIKKLQSQIPHWVRLSDRLPTTAGPHLVIFQNGRGGCLPFNVEAKSFQVAGTVQWGADGTDIFGDWTGDK